MDESPRGCRACTESDINVSHSNTSKLKCDISQRYERLDLLRQAAPSAGHFSPLRPNSVLGTPLLHHVGLESFMEPNESPLFVQALATGLGVLDAFTAERPTMNLKEISEAAGVTKSAAQRFTHTLVTLGLLRKDAASKRYSLSPRTLDTGYRYLQAHVLLERANPYLLDLNRQTGETVNLAERDGHEMVYIGRFPSPHRAVVHMPVGRRLPIFCSSAGRAFLSALPDEQIRHILTGVDRPRFTPHTITDVETLTSIIAKVRETGFAYSIEEFYLSDLAFAVPVYNIRGEAVAAVNLSVSTAYWSFERAVAELVPKLIHTARMISTTPPTFRAMEPFQIGYGKVRDVPYDKP